ncbi:MULTISPECIES: hypothetical protein [unclassified Psychrobacter]|uniref:hypothetical protein n=1 Tax=unclassified Psychrobacter TaxID=196806 RepID=UPI0025B601B0|nr:MULTISPECIES: hypothetical protein [unclassified Psychrobacter]MDN3454165.1 hypothetical protein [Psychrobacter sp. APC 3350]MDN3503076.1 hypothetical protein [Psychrobacter sp. 5A.1]
MKNQRSVIAHYNKSDKNKQSPRHANYQRGTLFISILMSILMISACGTELSSDDSVLVTDKSAIESDRHIQSSKNIEEGIRNSYARLASKRSDVCPKLIQEEVDSQVVERISEVMVNDYCDYFLYPRDGQYISVSLNDSQIEALLIVPTLHNFANGNYQVTSYDKHIIRLSYNGAMYKPEQFVYDVALSISDNEYS